MLRILPKTLFLGFEQKSFILVAKMSSNKYQSKISEFFGRKSAQQVTIKQEKVVNDEFDINMQTNNPKVKKEPPVEFVLILPPALAVKSDMSAIIKKEKLAAEPVKQLYYKCQNCTKSFGTSKSLSIHRKIHMKGLFDCQKCNQRFHMKGTLRNHKCRKMECNVCGKIFKTFEGYRHHGTFHGNLS
jgi:DNA-directed RNA polymerase subunit RPC12/RpoP